jgi:Ion channel
LERDPESAAFHAKRCFSSEPQHRQGHQARDANPAGVVSALIMLRRLRRAIRYALREEDFGPVLGAGGFLIASGTLTYSLGNGWNIIDAFYFAVATLTTSSIADPDLVLEDRWLKVFSVFYILIGIGILVEIARRFGMAFIEVRRQDKARRHEATTGA